MRKYVFFLIFYFCFLNIAATQDKPIKNIKGCDTEITESYLRNIDNLPIKLIEVDVHDYRKWTVNGIRILTSRYRYVQNKYKRRYDATILITYGDNTKCFFDARIRHSGDEKDHISQLDNSITQSLDVHLRSGNIRGITKFKLLRKNVRGNLEDEIFLTEILRKLNYLAPRTFKVSTRVNTVRTQMIFQEKAAKEMLEFNGRREGPILEGDERFFFKSVEKIEDNNLSGWDSGVVPLMNSSSKYMLSKQVNSDIAQKSLGHKDMSLQSSAYLNLIYLYFANRFQDDLNKFNYFEYDLDNSLLALFDKEKILKLDEYNLLIQATNSHHGLAINNRKFYWNSLENYFEPVNYDSNPNISKEIEPGSFRFPFNELTFNAFSSLKKKLNDIDIKEVNKKINASGINMTTKKVRQKLEKIVENLTQVEKNHLNFADKKLVKHNKFKKIDDILKNYSNNLKSSHSEVYLINYNQEENKFQRCEIYFQNCKNIRFSQENLSALLEGELSINNKDYQYLGKNLSLDNLSKGNYYKKLIFEDTNIYFDKGIEIKIDQLNRVININQFIAGSRIYFMNGTLEKLRINYNGFKIKKAEGLNLKNLPKNYPSDIKGLTGCLSFINLNVDKIDLNTKNSSCEDTVNFINVFGSINNIVVDESFSDGLDVDFSNLEINNIIISNAGNDCADFSLGEYRIKKISLKNCGDKALSIGEKSLVKLDKIKASKSNFGIASKDSSIVELNHANFNDLKTCAAAYNKKQEFNGGFIKIRKMKCNNYDKKIMIDKYSKILQEDKTL
ncbi:hypothetical protein CBE37_01245 [bacterium TMED277]|nr:MAG: hypothetical protein CBE37_01245 [bacterium TMED277]|tara:strand:- start:4275 stop:6629 length:2355 start_codon:yes stop_codon:yes gene_type:complete